MPTQGRSNTTVNTHEEEDERSTRLEGHEEDQRRSRRRRSQAFLRGRRRIGRPRMKVTKKQEWRGRSKRSRNGEEAEMTEMNSFF